MSILFFIVSSFLCFISVNYCVYCHFVNFLMKSHYAKKNCCDKMSRKLCVDVKRLCYSGGYNHQKKNSCDKCFFAHYRCFRFVKPKYLTNVRWLYAPVPRYPYGYHYGEVLSSSQHHSLNGVVEPAPLHFSNCPDDSLENSLQYGLLFVDGLRPSC